MRSGWDEYTISYRYYDTVYKLRFKRIKDPSTPVIILDGKAQPDNRTIHLVNDEQEHTVEINILPS